MDTRADYTFALAGNPNVGKSTVFNSITGLNQHTGNWAGKTVEICVGKCEYKGIYCDVVDLPGSYSLKADSEEENVTCEYIENLNYSAVIIVLDSNALERNLNFALQVLMRTSNAVVCLNMIDVAEKNGISIDTDELSLRLGVPVVKVTAKKNKGIDTLIDTAINVANNKTKTFEVSNIKSLSNIKDNIALANKISGISKEISDYTITQTKTSHITLTKKLDYIFTSKSTGIPIMILFILGVFWLTAFGANYPGELLSNIFNYLIESVKTLLIDLRFPFWLVSFICEGVLRTSGWVVAVMLPPALIFFPIFALLEDSGYLPRVAFMMDGLFMRAGTSGKQILTMLMGFGCNACGITGCRIISSQRERNIAILTNSFIPCNGRIPTLISLSTIFFAVYFTSEFKYMVTAAIILFVLLLSVAVTLMTTKILSKIYNTSSSSFIMELPQYKKPQFIKTIFFSIKNKAVSIVKRAVAVSVPAGAVIWLLANISIDNTSLFTYITEFLDPFAKSIGIDGTILASFLLGFPANEIVIPIILMSYTQSGSLSEISSISELGDLFISNGWNSITAVCVLVLCVFHFPCSTTCITIYKETKSKMITFLSVIIPFAIGITLCFFINLIYHIFV